VIKRLTIIFLFIFALSKIFLFQHAILHIVSNAVGAKSVSNPSSQIQDYSNKAHSFGDEDCLILDFYKSNKNSFINDILLLLGLLILAQITFLRLKSCQKIRSTKSYFSQAPPLSN